jgi:hypothetical protein
LTNHQVIRSRRIIVGIVLAMAVVACQGPGATETPRGDAGPGTPGAAPEARA